MNKKQLIVAWVMGIIISTILVITPKIGYYQNCYIKYKESLQASPYTQTLRMLTPLINWNLVLGHSLIVFIIGGLLIYTLRDKKK